MGVPGTIDDGLRGKVEELMRAGRGDAAVDLLADEQRRSGDPALAAALIDARGQVGATLARAGDGRTPWPPAYADPFPDVVDRLPEIPATDLDVEVLGGAVAHHGALLVRGLADVDGVAGALDVLRRADEARTAHRSGDPGDGWYRPVPVPNGVAVARAMVAEQGGTWLADSPLAAAHVLDLLSRVGAVEAIAEHFGERPCISLQKSTLRRSEPVFHPVAAWHQDGAFLDADVRTMNVWLALSPCGGDRPTPALEVVPKRIPEVLDTQGELVPHSVSGLQAAILAGDAGTACPEFDPGDALLFDERFLHRTRLTEGMTEARYAIESWFFAPSHAATTYLPYLV